MAEKTKASVLAFGVTIPITSAASSSSRMDINAKPNLLSLSK